MLSPTGGRESCRCGLCRVWCSLRPYPMQWQHHSDATAHTVALPQHAKREHPAKNAKAWQLLLLPVVMTSVQWLRQCQHLLTEA
jgi:hypothetical protein